jgi:ABC-type uncharacterized transport system permease subunit
MLGDGWIALAIVIFGGWHPPRGPSMPVAGQALSSAIQRSGLGIPVVLLNGITWVLMIVTLAGEQAALTACVFCRAVAKRAAVSCNPTPGGAWHAL